MLFAVFLIAAFAAALLLVLSLATLLWPRLRFRPPPQVDSWHYQVFWWTFRTFVLGVLVLSVADFGSLGEHGTWQIISGAPLAIVGFGGAFYMTRVLGWRDAHGEANELKTGGWYGWSRHPIYVCSIVGFVGVGLVVHSLFVYVLLAVWAVLYILAPFLEEPWLEEQYGSAYREYKSKVSRFVGRGQSGLTPR